ncbi:NIPSNAP family protein [Flagellimonas halotolerans]|uniref:NIPSNAP family protein n=1 Tax=Flagellimonas halotolerans TaxID=3112164 RepID=A0ABU6ITD4_9FLAO|nr:MULTISPECIES: NIPSNAP family protein [unclassified Allomuricauda]MEC3966386.1 NIPSNAP family protein [Muricauda sp. SYSU M86414]MEC4266251.1 NIPSNAP family protein [Muricauda sp. SYSU M84420]
MKEFFSILFILMLNFNSTAQEQVYELRTYELEFGRPEHILHDYFKDAFIPAMNRQGINNIGVFEEVGERLPKKIYVLIPYDDITTFQKSKELLIKDKKYLEDAGTYLKVAENLIPYSRISTDLIQSTTGFPSLQKPADNADFFELRIYESYNEDALRRKVKMFNDSEFSIFEDVGLPTVFFGSNIAGNNMPCLTYMLAFKDKQAHSEAWSKFGPHPEWKRISNLEEYAHAMNSIIRVFLRPVSYSQL